MEENSLVDIFRELHPESKRFTWRKKNPLKQARLDFFLVTNNLEYSISGANVETGYRSDHSPVSIDLAFNKFIKGKGLWKFNNSLLQYDTYAETIRKTISETKKQYCVPVYR